MNTSNNLYAYNGSSWTKLYNIFPLKTTAFQFLYNGRAYIASTSGLILSKGKLGYATATFFGEPFTPLLGNSVYDLTVYPGNELWASTDRGIQILYTSTISHEYTKYNSGLLSNSIRAVHRDSKNVYWIATFGGSICKFKGLMHP